MVVVVVVLELLASADLYTLLHFFEIFVDKIHLAGSRKIPFPRLFGIVVVTEACGLCVVHPSLFVSP